jgi:Domain of unknown function (DUF4402)
MMDVGTLMKLLLACAMPFWAMPGVAQSCQLCAATQAAPKVPLRPLAVSVDAVLDFGTAVHSGRGSGVIAIEARTGRSQVIGLTPLGGAALVGTVTITGEPFARIAIDLPRTITLNSNLGAVADVTEIRTDLSAHPQIGADGRLVFTFGGRLTVRDDAEGDFRGRIPLTVDYE